MDPNILNAIANKTKNAEIETACIKIQKMSDAIELDSTRLRNLPAPVYEYAGTSRQEIQNIIDSLTKKCQLLRNIEGNYNGIIRLAKTYPELGIDVMAWQKALIEWQKERQETEASKKSFQLMQYDTPKPHR